jgi:hypothetical protein
MVNRNFAVIMSLLRSYIVLLFIACISACNTAVDKGKAPVSDSGLLSASLVKNPYTASGTDTAIAAQLATLEFKDTTHDFGTIHEGDKVDYDFEFTNGGKSPLIVSKAIGSCGCTVAEFPREPLPPGKNGKITVRFDATNKTGPQNKTVTLTTNTTRGTEMLYITANVLERKEKK